MLDAIRLRQKEIRRSLARAIGDEEGKRAKLCSATNWLRPGLA